jgi:hypothetical protein
VFFCYVLDDEDCFTRMRNQEDVLRGLFVFNTLQGGTTDEKSNDYRTRRRGHGRFCRIRNGRRVEPLRQRPYGDFLEVH